MLVWDNQQEIRSWFSGILEGEGSADKGRINIYNTSKCIIDHCVNYLKSICTTYSIGEPKVRPKRRKVYVIQICGLNNCYTLIKTLGDTFQCRREEFMRKLNLSSSETLHDVTLQSDLWWLVGIFEAEGSLGLSYSRDHYEPEFSIKNSNIKILEKAAKALFDLGLAWHNSESISENPIHRIIYSLRIRGMKRCYRFLNKIGYLFKSKYYFNRAKLITEFIESRFKKSQKEDYSEREKQICQIIKLKI